jgi:hypothetical protein
MYKKTTLIVLIALFSIPQVFSQDKKLETDSSSNFDGFDMGISSSLVMVQDKFSPTLVGRVGIVSKDWRVYLVVENNYYFSTKTDNSRSRTNEMYYGIEMLFSANAKAVEGIEGARRKKLSLKRARIKAHKNYWGGIGVSYCPNPLNELHHKKPIKFYAMIDFGGVTIRTAYVWSDFFYPAVGVSFGF